MQHTYLASDEALTEVELATEVLSIKEAVARELVSPDFFDIEGLTEEELTAPNGIMVLKDGYGIAIQHYEDEELADIFNKKYLYEVQLVADEAKQVSQVYGLLYDYLTTCQLPVELWEAKAGLETYVEGVTKKLAQMKASDLEELLENEHKETTRRLNFV